jgi:hypothetical protein
MLPKLQSINRYHHDDIKFKARKRHFEREIEKEKEGQANK